MDETLNPDPNSPDAQVVSQDVNCQICGKSVRGLPINGDCPNCKTPVALSVANSPLAPAAAANNELVQGDRLCVKCGRNLRHLPADGFCPECRTPIRESAPIEIVSGQKVADDRPCLVCGYNLKGLETSGNCPECGTTVARSLRGFLLRYSAPEYIETLRRGILLVEVTLILKIVVGAGLLIFAIATGAAAAATASAAVAKGGAAPAPGSAFGGLAYEATQQIAAMILGFMGLLGMWMFSTQDPGLTTQDPAHKSRRLLRIFLSISAVIALTSSLLVFIPGMRAQLVGTAGGMPNSMALMLTVVGLAGLLGGIAQLVGFVATMNYMAHLSRRVPDAGLEVKAKRYRWMLPLIYVFGCGIGAIVAFVLYFILLEEWRKRLKTLNDAVFMEDVDILRAS